MYDATLTQETVGLQEPRWATVLKGIALVLFGLVALAWPGLTLVVLSTLFAVYVLVAGVVDVVTGVKNHGRGYWWLRVVIGALQVGVAVYLLERPGITLTLFVLLLGLTFLVRGVLEGVFAFDRDLDTGVRGLLAVAAVLSILAGFVILRHPLEGGVVFTWVLGIYALIAGPVHIALALRSEN